MASLPLDLEGKSVLIDEEEEEEVLSPMPLAFYNPFDDEVNVFEEILSPMPLDFYNPLEEQYHNKLVGEDIADYFNLSEKDDEGFEYYWDKVFRNEELYCKNCWPPLNVRETNMEGPSLSQVENSLPKAKRQRIDDVTGIVETEKEEVVEAFLAEPKKKDEN